MSKIEQKDINNAAWAACDSFRGVVDPAQYKDYILVMLFLKYISDVWQAHYDEYQGKYGDDSERILRKLSRERFVIPMVRAQDAMGEQESFRGTFSNLYERRTQSNIGELINETLLQIEEANKIKLHDEDGGVFRNIDFNSETNLGKTKDRNRRLKHLLEDFQKPQLDMNPKRVSEDVIGNTYIYLIERFASDAGKKAGEFYTPHRISELVAKLAGPKPGQRICDPACGSGGLLIEAAREVGGNDFALFGMEVNGSTWALAKMNMFIHGFDGAHIRWCNALTGPALVENDTLMKFEVVVANPPFSLDKWGAKEAETDRYNRFWRGVPPKGKGDWAFISHMVEVALAKQGRVAVVVPHGVLFRGGAEGRIRQKMIEENLLDAVIGLPTNLFASTSIPVAILIFDRAREDGGPRASASDVLFIDASHDYVASKNQNSLSDEHIDRVVETYRARKIEERFSHLAVAEEIVSNEYNLNIPRYVDTYQEEEEIDIEAVQHEIDGLEKDLIDVRKKMEGILQEIRDK